ncbi:thiol-disulfide oxidoreductase DCC family protein [Belliella kenyensis]|uniref:Thiol-disulfide oxidoreductase DCC family protein n=1 Tax=Belliella kenyensis TaxID=1472724 RepID=A0ABV8EMH5_9BACT|nr:DCC1-like thiol-disulfide oxidoreductase family protein [Belliella kenyensis]MCH7400700.1 DCC1-like thiol-disulfide oxidoreductase family protein [Belliella kenyensis]MDN3602013.1 DCC1-like thiol-disulfide oxidoreductase family protein [Belliella kenyensis]
MRIQDKYHIVLFDGVCNLCNDAIDFIIRNDKKNRFKVGALQDDKVKEILKNYQIDESYLDSLILVSADEVYYRSTAALKIAKNLSGLWPLLYGFIILPRFVRDPLYDWVAKNRYRWFGKKETCRLPTEEEKAKFI